MIFARQTAPIVQRARVVVRRFIRGGLVAILSCAGMAPAVAASYDGAMAKAEYTLVAGDVNGDGRVDFLVKSKPKLLMVPVGDDLSVPIMLPAPSPTFMLRSSAGGTYSLVSNPGAQDLAFAWVATDYQLAPALPEAGGNDALSIFTTTAGKPTFLVAMSPATGALQLTRTVWLPPAGSPANAMLPSDYAVFSADINGDKQNDVLFKARSRIVLIPDPASDDEDDVIISIIKPQSTTFALVSTGYGKYTLVVHPLAEILDSPLWKPATQTIAFSGVNGIFSSAVTITPVDREQASFVVSMKGDTGELLITSSAPPAVDMNTPPPLITVKRTPYPLEAGKFFDLTWSTTDATSMTRTCTADGTGFRNATTAVGASGAELAVRAKSEWISYPSTCTWSATGPGGTATFVETVNTKYVTLDGQPTIAVSHLPARFVVETEYALNFIISNGGGGAWHNCSVAGQRVYLAAPGVETIGAGRHVGMVPAAWGGKTLQCTFSAKNRDGLVAETSLSIPVDPIPPGGNIGQLTGNVAGVSIDGNGAASVHGYACFPKSTEALEVQVSVYDEAIDFKVPLIDGMTNIASSDAIASSCNTVGTGAKHGWSIPLGQFQKQYAGKVIHVRGLSKIGEPVMLPNSGRYSIPTGNLSGYLTASHTQIVTGSNGTADVTLEGAGTNGGGNVQHVALVWDKGDGSAPVVVETLTPSGSPSSVPIKKTMALGVGQHKFTLRITDSNWTTKELSPWVNVTVLGSTVFGATSPVYQEGGTSYLSAWACEDNRGDSLSYKVFTEAPSLALGGTPIASGVGTFGAFAPPAANQEKCHTPGTGYTFKIDLDSTRHPEDGPIAANTPLFVEVQTMSGAAVTLPSATGSAITMPAGVQIAVVTPANGDKVEAPGPVFISARVTGGVGPDDVVEFAIDNVWVPAKQDEPGSNRYYLLSQDNLTDLRFYDVRARVRNSSRVLAYSVIGSFEVTAKAFVRVAVPPVDAKYTVGSAVTLSATTAGLAAPVATLKFYLDGRELMAGTSSNGKWTATWTPTAAGTYRISASAFDSGEKLLGTAPAVVYNIGTGTGVPPTSGPLTPVAITPPHLGAPDAGTLAGSLQVGPDGAATYSVPLLVPPGTAGMMPELSLQYSSLGNNGLLGMGWSLGGLSIIHRCAKTIAQDGQSGRINFDTADRLCLDGKRLVRSNGAPSGAGQADSDYWKAGVEFTTEINEFSRITRLASGFKVELKNGRIHHYGIDSNTAIPGQGRVDGAVLAWALATVEDRFGNFLSYSYKQDSASGEYYPNDIRYGGNRNIGQAADLAVRFTFEARPDSQIMYIGGSRNDQRSRLSKIATFLNTAADGTGGELVREHSLQYKQSSGSGRSLLESMQACAVDPSSSAQALECLPKTAFSWGEATPAYKELPSLQRRYFIDSYLQKEVVGDFDASGMTSFMVIKTVKKCDGGTRSCDTPGLSDEQKSAEAIMEGSVRIRLPSGTIIDRELKFPPLVTKVLVGDLDGDGKEDLVLASRIPGVPAVLGYCITVGTSATDLNFACNTEWWSMGVTGGSEGMLPFLLDLRHDRRKHLIFGFSENATDNKDCYLENGVMRCVPMIARLLTPTLPPFSNLLAQPFFQLSAIDLAKNDTSDFYSAWTNSQAHSAYQGVTFCVSKSVFECKNIYQAMRDVTNAAAPPLPKLSGASSVGDLNGDGLTDFAYTIEHDGTYICLSRENDVDCRKVRGYATGSGLPIVAGDFFGDGVTRIWSRSEQCRFADWKLVCVPLNDILIHGAPVNLDASGIPMFTGEPVFSVNDAEVATINKVFTLAGPAAADRVVAVSNGIGYREEVEYARGDSAEVYSAYAHEKGVEVRPVYPVVTSSPGTMVKEIRRANGKGGWMRKTYSYKGAVSDALGRGSLGFAEVTEVDMERGTQSDSTFAQAFPFTGMARSTILTSKKGVELNRTTHEFDAIVTVLPSGGQSTFVFVKEAVSHRRDLDGSPISSTTTVSSYTDGWGNLNVQSVTTPVASDDEMKSTSTTTYRNDPVRWLIGLPDLSKVENRSTKDNRSITRSVKYAHDDSTGRLLSKTIEPGDATVELVTSYATSNQFGLVDQVTQQWRYPASSNPRSRIVSKVDFDPKGRYAHVTKNALGHAQTNSYYAGTGALRSSKDSNGLTTSWTADGFGRVRKVHYPDNSEVRRYFKFCGSDCPAQAVVATVEDTFQGQNRIVVPTVVYTDVGNRTIRRKTWGFDGTEIFIDQSHDDLGRVFRTYRPSYGAGAGEESLILERRYLYDELDREVGAVSLTTSNEVRTHVTNYRGLVTERYIDVGAGIRNKRTSTTNSLGQIVFVDDANNQRTQFTYDVFGNLGTTTDPKGNTIEIKYDRLGRKRDLIDPDLGWIQYDLDPLGRLVRQVSPNQRSKNEATTFEFDDLDRLVSRKEASLVSGWKYDSAPNGTGLLAEAFTLTGTLKDYSRTHDYDPLSRLRSTRQELFMSVYVARTEYDGWNRPASYVYSKDGSEKIFQNRYNDFGKLASVELGNVVLWQPTKFGADGIATEISFGNGLRQIRGFNPYTGSLESSVLKTGNGLLRLQEGYEYDTIDQVSRRVQYWDNAGFQEGFTYDALNRLETSAVDGKDVNRFAYDIVGNLTKKTGTGNGEYEYPFQGKGVVRPHAIVRIPGLAEFKYDDNGNMLGGGQLGAEWTSFDMPSKITRGDVWSSFAYGPERQRIRQTRSDRTEVTYAGSQEFEKKDGKVTLKTYWPHGLGVSIERDAAAAELYWSHIDRLGSPIAYTDQNGILVGRLAYDAWGKRRTLDGGATPDNLDGAVDNRGFTGHETLDDLDLVHMNGRIYEPLLGRFMSGDPIIQDLSNIQSYNRYTYVFNNPLNFTDPSGFTADKADNIQRVVISGRRDTSDDAPKTKEKTAHQQQAEARFMESYRDQTARDRMHKFAVRPTFNGKSGQGANANKEGDHDYTIWTKLADKCNSPACVSKWSEASKLFSYPSEGLKPTPADLSGKPQVVYGTLPFLDASNPDNYNTPGGRVIQVQGANGSITNVTLKDHVFCCGTITRTLMTSGDSLYMKTQGVGYNVYMATEIRSSSLANFNAYAGRQIFRALDQQLIKHVEGARD